MRKGVPEAVLKNDCAHSFVIVWVTVSGTFRPYAAMYGVNMSLATWTVFVLDAVRMPLKATFQVGPASGWWAGFHR
jgi:hypothetical protein